MKKNYLLTGVLCLLTYFQSFAQCSITNATTCVCEQSGSTNCDLLPDLIVARLPLLITGSAGIIEYSQTGNGADNGRLRVSVSTPNIGYGPLEIRAQAIYICGTDTFFGTSPGTCPVSGLPPKQLITQRVYHKNGNTMSYYERPAGSMTYHPSHGHMHVDDWGIYTLRTGTSDPNPLNWPIIGTGAKLSFCLEDYGSCSGYPGHCVDSLGNSLFNPNFPNFGLGGGSYNCSPVVQGISSGYTDIYYQYLDGMYITVPPGTCNGSYFVVVQLDPYNYFLESKENNNVVAVPFTLTQQGGAVPVITASGPTTFCPGGNVTLSAAAGNSYLWSTGATTQSITANSTGSYTVTVSSMSCSGTSQPVNVLSNVISVSAAAVNTSVCQGFSTQLNASASTSASTTVPVNFTNNTVINIPDNNSNGITSSVTVSGIIPSAITANTIVSVTVNITHTYDADLILSLISPSGNQVILSNRRGGNGQNYVNTVFRMNATTAIGSGSAPFTGSYVPDGTFSALTGNVNGIWQFKVADVEGNDLGTINSWTLQLNTQVPNGISYAWSSNPSGFTSSLQNPVVFPGTGTVYTVIATDVVTGCTGTATVSVNTSPKPTATIFTNSPVCQNGTIQLNVNSNGTSFAWSGPNGFNSSNQSPTLAATQTAIGQYSVTVTGSNGCTATSTTNINVLNIPQITKIITPVSCNGGNNGSINLTVTNNSGGTYLWSNGATTEDIANLTAGSYQVTVNNTACIVTNTSTVTQPAILSCACNATLSHVTCIGGANGSVTPQPSGGTPPYSYQWSNGQTTQTADNLTKGTYIVTITDVNNCSVIGSAVIKQPTALTFSAALTPVTCSGANNGAINITVGGGAVPYQYLWSTGATTEDIFSLSTGTYTVTITDNCGASMIKSKKIVSQTPALTFSAALTPVTCSGVNNGAINITVGGGAVPYQYLWSTGATTEDIFSLSTGTYTVTITDNCGASMIKSKKIVSQTPALTFSAALTPVTCSGANNGAINITVGGGAVPYQYLWSTGATTEDIFSLSTGTYTVTITDNCGASMIKSKKIVSQTPALTFSAALTPVTCSGVNNGAINITMGGGAVPYQYLWSTGATTEDISSLFAGTYTVTITDNCGTTLVKTKTIISQTPALTFSAALTNITCAGLNNGAINITVGGGLAPYYYLWNTGATTEDIASLAPDTYTVTITDNCGSSLVKTKTLTKQAYPFSLTLSKTNVTCPGTNTGIASVAVSGGTAPFVYAWNTIPVLTTASISGLHWGTYTVIVTDANGCTKSGSISVINATPMTAVITQTNVSVPGGNNGSASLAVSGGTSPYTYSWNTVPVKTTSSISGLTAGVYKCTITDSKLCTKKINVTITQPPAINSPSKAGIQFSGNGYLKIIPNPSDGNIELGYKACREGDAIVAVLDMIGKSVFTGAAKLIKGDNNLQIDLSNLPKGIYFIQMEQNGEKSVGKLILQ